MSLKIVILRTHEHCGKYCRDVATHAPAIEATTHLDTINRRPVAYYADQQPEAIRAALDGGS